MGKEGAWRVDAGIWRFRGAVPLVNEAATAFQAAISTLEAPSPQFEPAASGFAGTAPAVDLGISAFERRPQEFPAGATPFKRAAWSFAWAGWAGQGTVFRVEEAVRVVAEAETGSAAAIGLFERAVLPVELTAVRFGEASRVFEGAETRFADARRRVRGRDAGGPRRGPMVPERSSVGGTGHFLIRPSYGRWRMDHRGSWMDRPAGPMGPTRSTVNDGSQLHRNGGDNCTIGSEGES